MIKFYMPQQMPPKQFQFPAKEFSKLATIVHVRMLPCLLARGPHILLPKMPPD